MYVRPKKHLGQHFLTDQKIAEDITQLLSGYGGYASVLEVGPGTGVLTDFLIKDSRFALTVIDIDKESVRFLHQKYPKPPPIIVEGDFLQMDLSGFSKTPFAIIGNFPYNISSQIFFHVLKYKDSVSEVVCMLQKEVAERLFGKKDNGVLTVFLQTYYTVEYHFTVPATVFDPPPKVQSAVIRVRRNNRKELDCDEKLYYQIVKSGFQNRRKTLRNTLKSLNLPPEMLAEPFFDQRAEALTVEDFITLTQRIAISRIQHL